MSAIHDRISFLLNLERDKRIREVGTVLTWLAEPLTEALDLAVEWGVKRVVVTEVEHRLLRVMSHQHRWERKITVPPPPPRGEYVLTAYDGVICYPESWVEALNGR